MRHARTRRRFKFILSVLLAVCFIVFIESRIEAFVPQAGNFAELKLEEALGGRVKFSIGSLEGGILHPLEINDIRIVEGGAGPVLPLFEINSVKTNYRVWDIFFGNKKDNFILSKMLAGDSHIDINFVTKNRELSGFVRMANKPGGLNFTGYFNIPRKTGRVDFSGSMQGDEFDIILRPATGSVKAHGSFTDDGALALAVSIEHLKALGFDWKGSATMKHALVRSQSDPSKMKLEGSIETDVLELNYRQFLPVRANYAVYDGVLSVDKMQMGESFFVTAKAVLKKPYDFSMTVLANNVSLTWIYNALGVKGAKDILSGTMNGKFDISGTASAVKSDSRFEVRGGTMSVLDFDRLTAHLVGSGPVLRIEDSRITRQSGHFVLAGEMDLSKMGKAGVFDQITLVGDEEAINWDGMKTTSLKDVQETSMKKRLSSDLSLDFKKFVSQDKIDESSRYRDKMGLDYRLNATESLKMTVDSEDNFLGIEHKDRF